jgi:hypothetical protein
MRQAHIMLRANWDFKRNTHMFFLVHLNPESNFIDVGLFFTPTVKVPRLLCKH